VFSYLRDPREPGLHAMALYFDPAIGAKSAATFLVEKTLTDWFGLFLVMPVFVPILISSQSVAGEKERRTLEPLLSTPLTALELIAGKSIAALLPALILSWLAFFALCVGIDLISWHYTHALLLPNRMWLFGVGLIAPLFAFFGNGVAVLISARVSDARMAQQFSALFVLPMVGLVGGQVAGLLKAGTGYYAVQGLVVLLLDAGLLWASVRFFDRERLLGRWS
jgi:ABC-2 type transport system permease protein